MNSNHECRIVNLVLKSGTVREVCELCEDEKAFTEITRQLPESLVEALEWRYNSNKNIYR